MRFGPCLGLNTQVDADALAYDGQTTAWEAAVVVNADFVGGGKMYRRRPGYSLAMAGNWRNAFKAPNGRQYAVVNDVLSEVLPDLSTSPLVALTTPGRVTWAGLHDLVFWSNGIEQGLIQEGEATTWGGKAYPVESEAGRFVSPPPGTVLAAFAGRVWIADGASLYYTAGADQWQFLDAAGGEIPMSALVTMLQGVDDGLYVGTTAGVWFLAGLNPVQGMVATLVSPFPAIPASSVYVRSDDVTQKYNPAGAAFWMSTKGIMCGLPSGIVLQLTKNRVALDAPASFAAVWLSDRRVTFVLHP
jgi:hypothetical protein